MSVQRHSYRQPLHATALLLALLPLLHGCVAFPPKASAPAATDEVKAPSTAAQAARLQPHDAAARRLSDRMLAALVEANGVPGMGAAVWRDEQLIWTGAAGYRDVERQQRVDDDTVFRLASVSKLFAATAAARLKQQGALDVEAPVRSIVGYLNPRWPAITTTQLAAHTSGIPHYQPVDAERGGRYFTTMREAVDVFQGRELLCAPQSRYHYSSYGYTLLSAVVEEAARLPYLDYLSREIVPGLAIGPDRTDSDDPDASKAYEFTEGAIRRAPPHDYSYSWGGAGLGATAPGLASFGGRVLAGQVVSNATFGWMLTPARLADGSPVTDRDSSIGFGWRIGRDSDGERIAHHAGVTHGARSVLLLYPERKLAVSVLSNAQWVSSIEQTAIMLAAPFQPAAPAASVRCPTEAKTYDGQYEHQAITGTVRFALEDGVCIGVLGVTNAFGQWLNSFPQADASTLKIIGVDANGGLARAALITPIGIFDLRAQDGGLRYTAALGGTRNLSFNFRVVPAAATSKDVSLHEHPSLP